MVTYVLECRLSFELELSNAVALEMVERKDVDFNAEVA